MDSREELKRQYERLRHAIPPLPSPNELYKKIVYEYRQLRNCINYMSTLNERITTLRISKEGWKERAVELQVVEGLCEKTVLQFTLIRTELRMLFAVPPLLFALDVISPKTWQAIISQPQRDCDNRFLVMDHHVIETIIDDQLRTLDLHNAVFKEIHEALYMEEHNDSQSFQSSVLSSLEGLQKSIETHFRAHVAISGAEMKAIFEESRDLAIRKAVDEAIAKLNNSHKNDTQALQPDAPVEGMDMPQEHNSEQLSNEEELINDNADYMEGVESEDEFERQADEEWLAFRRRGIEDEIREIQERIEALESTIYSLDMEETCDPRDIEKGVIRREGDKLMRCVFCKEIGEHYSDSCPEYRDSATRFRIIADEKRCTVCLNRRLDPHECRKAETPCHHCGNTGHHSGLCSLPEWSDEVRRRLARATEERRAARERIRTLRRMLEEIQ